MNKKFNNHIDFNNYFETDCSGMCNDTSTYNFEEIYQAFKERLIFELGEQFISSITQDNIKKLSDLYGK